MTDHARGLFVGRSRELRLAATAWSKTRQGHGSILLLSGEPGIGKTRLAEEIDRRCARTGGRVAWGRCHDGEETSPFGPWSEALGALVSPSSVGALRRGVGRFAGDLERLVPDIGRIAKPLSRRARRREAPSTGKLAECVMRLLREVSAASPLLLVLEDLHQADASSLRLMVHLAGMVPACRLLAVLTFRDQRPGSARGLNDMLGELVKHRCVCRMDLSPLDSGDIDRYLAHAAPPTLDRSLLERTRRLCEGNPLYLRELCLQLKDASCGEIESLGVPKGIEEFLSRRLGRLSGGCRELLRWAAVLGRNFELGLVCALLGRSEGQAVFVEEALRAGFIRERPDRFGTCRFVHDLIREALLAEMSSVRRAELHRSAAAELARRYGTRPGPHAGEIAAHLAQSTPVLGSNGLAAATVAAAEYCLDGLAPESAVELVDRALELLERFPAGSRDRRGAVEDLYAARGRALGAIGSASEAGRSIGRAFDMALRAGRKRKAVRIAQSLVWRPDAGKPYVTWYGGFGTPEVLGPALFAAEEGSKEQAQLLLREGHRPSLEKALLIARTLGDSVLEARALARFAHCDFVAGDFAELRDSLPAARSLAAEVNDAEAIIDCENTGGRYGTRIGDPIGADASIRAMLSAARAAGSRPGAAEAELLRGSLAALTGEWEVARSCAHGVLSSMPDTELTILTEGALIVLGVVELELGRPQSLMAGIAEAARRAGVRDIRPTRALARAAYVIGSLEPIEGLKPRVPRIAAEGPPISSPWADVPPPALLAVLRGDRVAAEASLEPLRRLSGALSPGGSLDLLPDMLLGMICRLLGRRDDARRYLEDAVDFCDRATYRPLAAWSRFELGVTLGGQPGGADRKLARQALERCRATARELGMAPLVARAGQVLNRLDAKGSRPLYPDGLTEREVAVLRLLGRGLTNAEIGERLFVSSSTVATHVHNLLEKTGTANRAEAVAYAIRNRITDLEAL